MKKQAHKKVVYFCLIIPDFYEFKIVSPTHSKLKKIFRKVIIISNGMMVSKQQVHSPYGTAINVPRNVKAFGVTRFKFTSFEELIQKSSQELGVEFEFFFSNSSDTQHGFMRVVDGKVVKTIPLASVCILSAQPVNCGGTRFGFLVKYFRTTASKAVDVFISRDELSKVDEMLELAPQGSKKKDELCRKLLKTLIFEKANEEIPIEIPTRQGWFLNGKNSASWQSRDKYPVALKKFMPREIMSRHTARFRHSIFRTENDMKRMLMKICATYPELKIVFLIRISSYFLTLGDKYRIVFDQIVWIKTNGGQYSSLLTAMLDNIGYGSGQNYTLSCYKEIEKACTILNDGVLLICDDTKADETTKREKSLDILQHQSHDNKNANRQIAVVLSDYAGVELRSDLYCDFSVLYRNYDISPAVITELMEYHDSRILASIEEKFSNFINVFNSNIEEISIQTPHMIPAQRRNIYYLLVGLLRTYNEFFCEFFDDETERAIVDILSIYNEIGESNGDFVQTLFGKCLNDEISSGRFQFINRSKYIAFDKGSDSVIVDDNNIYIETDVVKSLAKNKLKFHSVNLLTDELKNNDCLTINDKNSKCYRFHVQNSNGEPYMLYTYGISKKLINPKNRKLLEIAGMQKFLLSFSELEQKNLLPLGTAADNSFVGKDISYGSKSNDHIFITGQSGKGKTFYATNLLPSLAMLGSRMCVLDVSGSFTRDEVLRALPQDVVDGFFEFIEVDVNKHKLPINPLYIGDCIGLPAKKRRVVSFIKAIAGKLDKAETKIVTGLISEILKKNDGIITVNTDMLLGALKRCGPIGYKVSGLISSALDDIERIGYDAEDWSTFFKKSKKIPVISLVNESGDNVHSMLDVLISSVFEWQKENNTAPLTIVVDEIKDQNFAEGSPLHTILTQGRKFNTKLIGMTQQYISQGNHSVNVIKEAGIKVFFRPSKSLDRIAIELGYKSPADAGFGSMGIGDCIISCDLFNKADEVNEYAVMHCKTVNFTETPLYQRFIHSD